MLLLLLLLLRAPPLGSAGRGVWDGGMGGRREGSGRVGEPVGRVRNMQVDKIGG